jgi:protease I
MLGGNVAARAAIDMVRVDEYDAVLLVGGDGAQVSLWTHAGLHSVLRQARDRDAVIGAICLAPVALARAGLVDGETAVARSPASLHELESRGVRVAAQDVLVSGRVITASGPQVAEQWARAVIAALAVKKEHRKRSRAQRGVHR